MIRFRFLVLSLIVGWMYPAAAAAQLHTLWSLPGSLLQAEGDIAPSPAPAAPTAADAGVNPSAAASPASSSLPASPSSLPTSGEPAASPGFAPNTSFPVTAPAAPANTPASQSEPSNVPSMQNPDPEIVPPSNITPSPQPATAPPTVVPPAPAQPAPALPAGVPSTEPTTETTTAEEDKPREPKPTAFDTIEQAVRTYQTDRLWAWLQNHAPNLIAVFLGTFFLQWLIRVTSNRIVESLSRRALHGSQVERENRAKTLSSVFQNTASLIVYAGMMLIVLDELGVPISTLLGGVAVLGLAVAFGAQNLIRDYFYGFMILLENQYGVNDVVRIAGISGVVERVTLRMTMLRDADAVVHFIPHGEVKTVSNLTHGWSRAVLEIRVGFDQDLDQVMNLLMALGRQLRTDPVYGPKIIEDPEMLGVDAIGDSFLMVKFFIKTYPLQQWSVRREMLRRISQVFQEEGIAIPRPSQVIYYRSESELEQKNNHLNPPH